MEGGRWRAEGEEVVAGSGVLCETHGFVHSVFLRERFVFRSSEAGDGPGANVAIPSATEMREGVASPSRYVEGARDANRVQ